MTCKYNIPLEINSNWFFKIHLGKQCCLIHRQVMGILEGISAKSIINLSVNCSLALARFGPKDWNYFFMSFHTRWLWSCLQDAPSLVGNLHFFETVTFARNVFHMPHKGKEVVSYVGYLFPKQSLKANDTFFPFEFHCYFENAFHVKKSSLFLLGVAQPF